MAEFISEQEFLKLQQEKRGVEPEAGMMVSDIPSADGAEFISEEEFLRLQNERNTPNANNPTSTIGAYLRTVPATAVDITLGAGEGFTSAIGEFTGDYDLARKIGAIREDVNDAIMGDVPDDLQSDFIYKLSSGLGSTLPYLGAAILSKNPRILSKVGVGSFFLSSAGQQVRDDYLATQGVTSETASDEQMRESNAAGALGAIPIALAERLGAGIILRPFAKGAIPAGKVMERISQYAAAGAGEAITEATQSGLINSIASYVRKYDPDRPITAGMAESALIGFLVGGGVNLGVDSVSRKLTQADRLKAGVQDGSINPEDVIDPEVGSKLTEIAMENDGIPEADTAQQQRITNPQSWSNFVSKSLTPITRRLGRAGKEIVREFRRYEMDTGIKTKELKERLADFQTSIQKLKKTSPEDYKALSLALANANELATSLPNSTKRSLEKKAQIQPNVVRSQSEQLLDETNPEAQQINTQIEQAREALSQRGMKTRIEVVEDGNSFYDPTANVIVISAEQADGTTVAHEFFHAALGQAVKTDAELQGMTRNMFDSVIRATVDGSSLNEQLKGFVSQYDQNIQNEEFLAQTVGELARQYQTLDLNTKTRIKVWINQAMQALGIGGVFKQAETDAEVVEQLNAFARFAGQPEALTGRDGAMIQSGTDGDSAISEPIRATKFTLKDLTLAPKVDFSSTPRSLSNITSRDSLDIISLINDAIANNKKVVFWQADQLGIGDYTSGASGKVYELDAGLGFAKSNAKGRKGLAWATGKKAIANKIKDADLVFMISGNPQEMHLFNKNVFELIYDNVIASQGSVEKFIEKLRKSKNTTDNTLAKNLAIVNEELTTSKKYPNPLDNPNRKDFSLAIADRISKKTGQGSTDDNLWNALKKIYPSPNELRDGHLVANNFGIRDIYAVFEPNGKIVEKPKIHSTYPWGVGGKFLGTPDRVINLSDILSDDYLEAFKNIPKNKGKSEGTIGQKLAGSQQPYRFYEGKDLRPTTPQQVSDAIARETAAKPATPATQQEVAKGAKAIKKKQVKVRGTVNFKNWFGKGELVHSDGEPMVFYHGTKADFTEFTSKENIDQDELTPEWLYFGTNPMLAEEMARLKEGFDKQGLNADDRLQQMYDEFAVLPKDERKKITQIVAKSMVANEDYKGFNVDIIKEIAEKGVDGTSDVADFRLNQIQEEAYIIDKTGMNPEELRRFVGMSVMPVYINAKNIFNPKNENHVKRLLNKLSKDKSWVEEFNWTAEEIGTGEFRFIENPQTAKALKKVGFDGAFLAETNETGLTTVAIWDNTGVKSATGNTGAYSSEDPDIRYQKDRTASDKERIRGLSDDGLRILEKHGMVRSYTEVRNVLEQLKDEYQALGLDMNYIDNYFPRLMQDLEGFKSSIGQTTGIDEEIRRYENMTGQKLTLVERQKMYEKLARSRLYRGGVSQPKNLKERRIAELSPDQLKYYANPEEALDEYVDRMVQTIETKKLIGDAQSGKTQGQQVVAGRLGEVMEEMAKQGRLRQDQIDVVQGAVAARFGQHGRQYGFVKGMKNAGYLATMGNTGSTLTQLGDFYFTMVQNGLMPTIQSLVGSKALTVEDLGIAKDLVTVETKDGKGFLGKSVDNVFKITGLTAMDRLAKNTNINAAYRVLQKGAKSKQGSKAYEKTLSRLKRTQGNDAYKTIADLQQGKKSDFVIEALYNELADVAPISLSEMPENYSNNPNLRILYSLKSYTIKQFNFVRERAFNQITEGIATGDVKKFNRGTLELMRILAFGALANGSADVLKAILFNREIDDEDFWWNHFLRIFGITKYTTVTARKKGVGEAIVKTVLPPQAGIIDDIFRDISKGMSEDGIDVNEMRSSKYIPVIGKLYYWREGKGVETEEKLSRLRGKD